MVINKIIHVYFSHMTYLMSHITSLNNIYEMNGLVNYYVVICNKQATNQFIIKPYLFLKGHIKLPDQPYKYNILS